MSNRFLLTCGIVGPPLFVVVFTIEGALRASYDPLRMQVSLLSLGERGPIQVANFLVSGTLLLLFAIGLRQIVMAGHGAASGPFAIAAVGLGLLVAGAFPVQPSFGYPPGAPPGLGTDISAASYVHVVGAFLFVLGMVVAAVAFALRFRAAGRRGWAAWSALAAIVVVACFGASSGGPDGMPLAPAFAGLFQRISIITGLVWVASLAAGILGGAIESATSGFGARR
jgi:uncharacterized membrane protein YhaH (DUF805 family)